MSIGTSTLFAAWNAVIYVNQIEDERLDVRHRRAPAGRLRERRHPGRGEVGDLARNADSLGAKSGEDGFVMHQVAEDGERGRLGLGFRIPS